jgi:hypothetical protein
MLNAVDSMPIEGELRTNGGDELGRHETLGR